MIRTPTTSGIGTLWYAFRDTMRRVERIDASPGTTSRGKHTACTGALVSRRNVFLVLGADWRTRGAVWFACLALLVAACGRSRSQLDYSLHRAEELIVLLEGIGNGTDAEAAAGDIADWVAGWELHGQRTAGLESVSGSAYVSLVESRRSRTDDLKLRLRRQLDRLAEEPYLERYGTHMTSALAILPSATPE